MSSSAPASPQPVQGAASTTSIEALLVHREWLRGLASRLVADPSRADDVAQQAWLTALERAPKQVRHPRAWLATVLRSWVLRDARSESRRRVRESSVARRDVGPATIDVVARAEWHRRVVNLVMELDEPYRTTVLLRFHEGLPPREVAARTGTPVETVRTRVRRGLERIRRRLDDERGGRAAWCTGLVASCRPDAGVPGRAGPPSPEALGNAGSIAMATGWKIAAVAAALAVLAWSAWPAPDAVEGGSPGGLEAATVERRDESAGRVPKRVRAAGTGDDAAETGPGVGDSGDSPLPPRERTMAHAVGRVIGLAEDERRSGRIELRFLSHAESPLVVRGDVAPDGSFDVPVGVVAHADARYFDIDVVLDHPGYLPARKRIPVPRTANGREDLPLGELLLDAVPARAVVGSVRGPGGGAIENAAVLTYAEDAGSVPVDISRTGPDGGFTVRVAAGSEHLLVAHGREHEPRVVRVPAVSGDVGTLSLGAGRSVHGTVLGPDGLPLTGTAVGLGCAAEGRTLATTRGTDESADVLRTDGRSVWLAAAHAPTDPRGGFAFAGLSSRTLTLVVAEAPRTTGSVRRASRWEGAPPARDVRLVLRAGTLAVRVTSNGEPVPNATVLVVEGGAPDVNSHSLTDASGALDLLVAADRPQIVFVSRAGFEDTRLSVDAPATGDVLEVPVELTREAPDTDAPGSVAIELTTPDGAPVKRVLVGVRAESDTENRNPMWVSAERDGDVFRVGDVEPGRTRLTIRTGTRLWYLRGDPYVDHETVVEVHPGRSTHVAARLESGALLRLSAVDADGALLPANVRVHREDGAEERLILASLDDEGKPSISANALFGVAPKLSNERPSDASRALPPGRYEVTFSLDGYAEQTVEVDLHAGQLNAVRALLAPTAE